MGSEAQVLGQVAERLGGRVGVERHRHLDRAPPPSSAMVTST